ncbi:MAG: S9 family peptidase, partial [Acidobacteriota bacterium]|nr:S9 family peptidase [Acidobacteriota bacterium]
QDQSDSMVEVFEENGVEVTYALYPDEGHGLGGAANGVGFWAMAEAFLGQCLGGRDEPLTDQLIGSSAQIRGAEHIPGLTEAIARRDAAAGSGP